MEEKSKCNGRCKSCHSLHDLLSLQQPVTNSAPRRQILHLLKGRCGSVVRSVNCVRKVAGSTRIPLAATYWPWAGPWSLVVAYITWWAPCGAACNNLLYHPFKNIENILRYVRWYIKLNHHHHRRRYYYACSLSIVRVITRTWNRNVITDRTCTLL